MPSMQEGRQNAPNCAHITKTGDAGYIVLSDYKTAKCYGCDLIMLGTNSPLLEHMRKHLQLYRHHLQGQHENNFLFLLLTSLGPAPLPAESKRAAILKHLVGGLHQGDLPPVRRQSCGTIDTTFIFSDTQRGSIPLGGHESVDRIQHAALARNGE